METETMQRENASLRAALDRINDVVEESLYEKDPARTWQSYMRRIARIADEALAFRDQEEQRA